MVCVGGGCGNDYLRTYILAYIAGLYTLSLYNYTRCESIVHMHACVCTSLCIHAHMHTHHTICTHIIPYAYTSYHMHTHHTICTHIIPYAYTSYHMHTHPFRTYRVINSYTLCHASCSMLAITVTQRLCTLEIVCPMCVRV